MSLRHLVILAVAALALVVAPSAQAQDPFTRQAWNILAPGQSGSVPPNENSTDQLARYDALTPLFDGISESAFPSYFKPNDFRPRGDTNTERPRRGVTIRRDSWGVPFIRGRTRGDVAFGSGWAAAQDRSLLFEQARNAARVAVADVPGVNAFGLVETLRTVRPSAQAEAYLDRQVRRFSRLRRAKPVLRDIDSWVAGVNAWYEESGNAAPPWTRNDVVAVMSFVGSIFGEGGGTEVRNAEFLARLQARLGPAEGLAVFRDLRAAQDPEAPTSTNRPAPYNPIPNGPTPGSAVIDAGSTSSSARAATDASTASRRQMSNALLVGPRRSRTRNSLFVAGPQLGYYYPEIVHEQVLVGGGYRVRGIFAAGPLPIIGRGPDYAWSLTSSNTDIVDQFLEELCNPDGSAPTRESTHYRYKGQCREMSTFDAGTVEAQGERPEQRLVFRETVHGPVSGTVTVSGRPYAVANQRSTRGREPRNLLFLADMGRGKARTAKRFTKIASGFEYTFNWHYANDRQIGFFSSARAPRRAPGTDPSLPTLGTGEYDWRGFLTRRQHPQDVKRGGFILNWNNKPAPRFASSDDDWGTSSVHRLELFDPIKSIRRVRLSDVVSVMNRAATQDLRVVEVWPEIREVLATGPAPSPRAQQAADLITDWERAGASRLDRDGDGKVDHPGAAITDVSFPDAARGVLGPVLTDQLEFFETRVRRIDGHPSTANGSAFGGGWYGYVEKDLRSLLGKPVRGAFSRRYCGNGDLAACREALWSAIERAANDLAASQGGDPTAWRADATEERLNFVPGLIPDTARWTNRPTFQQVLEFNAHRR